MTAKPLLSTSRKTSVYQILWVKISPFPSLPLSEPNRSTRGTPLNPAVDVSLNSFATCAVSGCYKELGFGFKARRPSR